MDKIKTILVLASVISSPAFGSEFLKSFPAEFLPSEIVRLETLPNYHFELKAPQKCDASQPLSASPRKILCRFQEPGEHKIHLSVCDNAKTFCRPTEVSVKVAGQKEASHQRSPSEALQKTQAVLKEKTLPGFLHVLPSELSRLEKKPVFVMIGTDWCPPCNEAKEALLSTHDFQKATSDWTRVYVDGDSAADSKAWNEIAPFAFYPTFVLLNSDLKEIARYHGAFRLADFQKWADQARTQLSNPIADLEKTVERRQRLEWGQWLKDLIHQADKKKDQDRLIEWALAGENKDVLKLFKDQDVPQDLRADWFRLQPLIHPDLTDEQKLILKIETLEAGQGSENFTSDLQDLCSENVSACKPWVEKLSQRNEFWARQKFANSAEKAVAFIEDYANQADIYNSVGDKGKAKKAAEVCVQAADEMAKNSPLKFSRASGIGASYCLEQVGRPKDAEKIYQTLLKTYGNEATFYLRYANFLKNQKRLKEALQFADKATENAYGYNWMKAVTLKAKIQMAMRDKTSARNTIQSALKELDLSSADPQARDQRLAKMFRELEESLEAKN